MKPPKYYSGDALAGEPSNPVKTTIDRSKYAALLNKPIDGTGTNFVADSPNSLNPAVLKANGYKYVSGTMAGKDIVYEKGGNYHLYNEQPNAAQNKYGLINIGNPYAATNQTTITTAPAITGQQKPAADPNRLPLNLSNPNLTYDPNSGTYSNPITGAKINPIVEQYKKGGKIKAPGYANAGFVVPQQSLAAQNQGPVIQPTGGGNSYATAFANANQQNAANQQVNSAGQPYMNFPQKQANQNRNGKIAQGLGGAALGVGTSMYNNVSGDSAQTKQTEQAIDSTAASVLPWYGLAKGASDIGRSQLPRDQYGNVTGGVNRGLDEFMAPQHENALAAYQREGALGVAKEFFTPAAAFRGGADILGLSNRTSGLAGAINKFSGNTAINKKIQDQQDAGNQQMANQIALFNTQQKAFQQGRVNAAIAQRDNMETGLAQPYYRGVTQIGSSGGGLGFAEGGKIQGAGTAKSDSINAKVKPGSFVVPAKNAPAAEVIRKTILKAPVVKANLSQKGGESVRLSNGEHLFNPREVDKLESYGMNLDILAPDADNDYTADLRQDAVLKKNGGNIMIKPSHRGEFTAFANKMGESVQQAAAHVMANKEDYSAAREKQAVFAHNFGHKDGGMIDGYKSGGPTAEKSKEILRDGTIRGKNITNKQKRYFGWIAGGKKADGGEVEGYQDGGKIAARKAAAELQAKQDNYRELQQRINNRTATPQDRVAFDRLGKELNSTSLHATPSTSRQITPPVLNKSTINPGPFSRDWATQNPGPNETPVQQSAAKTIDPTSVATAVDPNGYGSGQQQPGNTAQGKKGNNFDYGKLLDYGVPAVQAGLGLAYLNKAGARPVDQLDPQYLNSIATAQGNVALANSNAKYGFSPEEQAAIDQQNAGLTNAGRYDARNFSGGSAGNALNMERSVINDSFARGLAAKAQNRNLIFQKQNIAQDRQQYLDSLIGNKVNMSNRLFNLKLDAWNQTQNSGQQLLGAGLSNLIGAKQWQDEQTAAKQRQQTYNPQYPTNI